MKKRPAGLVDKSFELQMSRLRSEIVNARGISDRLRLLARFFDYCQNVLKSPDRQARYHVFVETAYLLSDHVCGAAIWDWLEELSRTADEERQLDLRIAIFELVPDPPINWAHLFRLWDMWFDPQTRWAVYSAYFLFPRRVHQHLRRYIAHRRRLRLPLPKFSSEELNKVLKQQSG